VVPDAAESPAEPFHFATLVIENDTGE